MARSSPIIDVSGLTRRYATKRTVPNWRHARWAVPVGALVTASMLAAVAAPAAAVTGTTSPGGPVGRGLVDNLTLPHPSGRYQVGTVDLRLVDHATPNPWTATPPYRELMASVYYPATDTGGTGDTGAAGGYRRAPQFPAGTAAAFDALNAPENNLPSGRVDWAATRTWAYQDAPVDTRAVPHSGFPVVLYSPGAGDPRGWDTTLVEDLASRGYVVVSLDHTYDASGVEFPDGRVEATVLPRLFAQARHDGTTTALYEKGTAVRTADVSFVLNELTRIAAGHGPAGLTLPSGLSRELDLNRVGVFGQSAGGTTAAQAAYTDPRIKAGIDMDGILEYAGDPTPGAPLMSSAAHGVDRPFLLMGSQSGDGESLAADPSWRAFYDHDRDWVRDVTLTGSRHASYTDAETLVPQVVQRLGLPESVATDDIGTIAPARAVDIERTYVAAFFDRWLRGGHDTLLDGPSRAYPEVVYQH